MAEALTSLNAKLYKNGSECPGGTAMRHQKSNKNNLSLTSDIKSLMNAPCAPAVFNNL